MLARCFALLFDFGEDYYYRLHDVHALARLSSQSRQAIQADLARYSVAAISSLAFVGDISPTMVDLAR